MIEESKNIKYDKLIVDEFQLTIRGHNVFAKSLQKQSFRDLTGTAFVFLHDGLGSVDSWRDIPHRLTLETGIDSIIYDRRGYGRSSSYSFIASPNYLKEEALQILPEILKNFNIRVPILIGHSDGATIALIFSGLYSDIKSIVVSIAAHTFVEKLTIEGINKTIWNYKFSDLKSKLEKYHFNKTDNIFNSWSSTWLTKEFISFNIFDYVKKIKSPILLIQGENDEFGTIAQVKSIKDLSAGFTQSLIIPDCGHFPQVSHKDVVIPNIINFVEKIIKKAD